MQYSGRGMTTTLRPLSLGELLDRTFQVYRDHFLLFVGITMVAYLPRFVIQIGLMFIPKARGSGLATFDLLLNLLLTIIAVAATQAGTVTAVSAVYLDQKITVWESYSRIMGMIPRVILVMIGMGIGIVVGLVLLIVPGIILALMWALTIPVVVLENADLIEALTRSRDLTSGHRLRVLTIFVLFTILTYLVIFLFEIPVFALVAAKGQVAAASKSYTVLISALMLVSQCLVTPLMTIAFSLMYYDERVRKEAFDIQLMMSGPPEHASTGAPGLF
jgi:glycerophosphoryl diester phosphodiesterase family protein